MINESSRVNENEVYTTLTMVAKGRTQNNNTRFVCYSISIDGDLSLSSTVTIVIAGPPLPPSPVLRVTNATSIQVSWEKPFVMREVADVLYYAVKMYNASSQGSREWRVESLPSKYTYAHNVTMKEVAVECILLTFEVRAVNKVGSSTAGTVSGGFPIVPRATVINPIEATLEMSVTGGLMAEVVLWPAHTCPYQETQYSLTVKTVPGGEIVQSRMLSLQPQSQNQSIAVVLEGLQYNVSYQFSSTVESPTGVVTFSTMATYAAGDLTDDTASSAGCISILTESMLTVFCTPSDTSNTIAYNCSIDGGPSQSCLPPVKVLLTSLPVGQHVLQISGSSTTWHSTVKTIQFAVNPFEIKCIGSSERGLFIIQCTSNRAVPTLLCSIDGGESGSCYAPIRLSEHTNRSHILVVQGYSEQGEHSMTTLNFTGTLASQDVKFTRDSPILVGRHLTVFVEASKTYDSVICEVHMQNAQVPRQDCSSGTADFSNLPEGEAVVKLSAKVGGDEIASTRSRVWVYDDPKICAPYLVNDMISTKDGTVRVTFGSSGKPTGYTCNVDSGEPFPCSSPVSLSGLHRGRHTLHVRPERCNSYQTSSFSFEI